MPKTRKGRTMSCDGVPERGPDDKCTCDGCWFCIRMAVKVLGDFPVVRWFGSQGHISGCTCDVDWECMYGRHNSTCGGVDE